MIPTQSLSEWLRQFTVFVYNPDGSQGLYYPPHCTVAADALDAKDAEIAHLDTQIHELIAEIELLKEGRKLHDEHADHLEHELDAKNAEIARLTAELAAIRKEKP